MAKPENMTATEYVAELERKLRNRTDDEGFFLASTSDASGQSRTFRPIHELRQELAMAKQAAAMESLGTWSPFISDCAL